MRPIGKQWDFAQRTAWPFGVNDVLARATRSDDANESFHDDKPSARFRSGEEDDFVGRETNLHCSPTQRVHDARATVTEEAQLG